jgi:glycosyltransferase involved in cell wall biosynthesis
MAATKVAYLSPTYFDDRSFIGGGERYPLNLARGVVESSRGACEVELISFSNTSFTRPLYPGVSLRVLTAAAVPSNPLDVVSWELPAALADADLVHIHQAYTRCSELGLFVAKQQRKVVCVTDHGGGNSPIGTHVGSLELVDRIIAYSRFGASLYRTGVPIEVIMGGVDGSYFAPPVDRPKRDRILYVGRLLPHKGIDQLITALPADLPLTVCGRCYHDDYFGRLNAFASGKRVEFITNADDDMIRDLYARAWVNVLPSVYQDCYGTTYLAPELMGFSLLESMACGTPVICSRVAAMPEFVREGETGFVFDDGNQLTAILRRLAENPTLVESMGRQARLAVEQEFDLKVAGARLWAVYEALLSEREEAAAA